MLLVVSAALAEVQSKTALIGMTTVHYKVVLPKGYDPAKAYPAVLAFGGGPQTMEAVDRALWRNWQKEAELRGYIVIVLAAPDGVLFFQGGEKIFPEFIFKILADYKIQANAFHAAGYSNGGTGAFLIAALYPQYFLSITAFPGYLLRDTATNLKNISRMCINMYVGELDSGFRDLMQKQFGQFRELGMCVTLSVEKGQGHMIETLSGAGAGRLFNGFDDARRGCSAEAPSSSEHWQLVARRSSISPGSSTPLRTTSEQSMPTANPADLPGMRITVRERGRHDASLREPFQKKTRTDGFDSNRSSFIPDHKATRGGVCPARGDRIPSVMLVLIPSMPEPPKARIIWRELCDLELHLVDEQIGHGPLE